MRINSLIKSAALSTAIALSAISCSRPPLKEMPSEYVSQTTKNKIDSLRKLSQKDITSDYECYGKDTLELTSNFEESPSCFIDKINAYAKSSVKRIVVGKRTYMQPIHTGKSTILAPRTKNIYEDSYLYPKGVIKSDKLFTTDSVNIYLPVEYYGIANPKTKTKS